MAQVLAVSVLVVVLMLSVGLRTDPGALRAAFREPREVVGAALSNLVLVPLLVWGATSWAALPVPVATGFLLCAVCPGGPSGALFASLARADLAVAATATIALTFLGVVTAPLTLSALLGVVVDLDVAGLVLPMMRTLAIFQVLPLVVGMALRHRRPAFAARWAGPLARVANFLLLAVVLGFLATRSAVLGTVGGVGLATAAGLVVASLLVGGVPGRTTARRRSLALVTAVRNVSLALLLAASWFPDPLVDAAVLSYGLFTMTLPLVFARIWARRAAAA